MSMIEWAEREVELACKREKPDRKDGEWDYGCACYESALKAFKSLTEDGHSGFSINITRQILNRLILSKPLTPIEDTPDMWNQCGKYSDEDYTHYQCKRMGSLFKYVYPDGRIEYKDIDLGKGVLIDNQNLSFSSGLISKIAHELCPITMPYSPYDYPIKIYVEEFLTDPANGDFDTTGVIFAKMPDGTEKVINRFFKDYDESPHWKEIDAFEYGERKRKAEKLKENNNA